MAPQNAQQFTTAWAIRQERAFERETKTVTNGQKKLQMGGFGEKRLTDWEEVMACFGRVRVVGATRRDDLAEARSGLSAHRVCRINNAPGGSVQRLCCASVTLFGNSIALWGGPECLALLGSRLVFPSIALSLHFWRILLRYRYTLLGGVWGKAGFGGKRVAAGWGASGFASGMSGFGRCWFGVGCAVFRRGCVRGAGEGAHVGRPRRAAFPGGLPGAVWGPNEKKGH